ncbi:MAG: PorV/PorQ family protein [Flavobacteriales bacterium]|nr:PorV/PorQ family protein [Flavobacteriales bacterium]MCL4283159.1 PorV/PorQ family protein [Flavobacteriales bacterium]
MKNSIARMMAAASLALIAGGAWAGNPDRAGSAGATQLLINPWARSNGWSLANSATLRGAEGMFGNVAGLAHVRKTELLFTTTRWLEGSGVKINAVGFGQKLGESGVLGITATTLSFGEIPVTTVDQPEGGLGTFSPTQANIGLAYSKAFSNSIFGGLLVRVVSESISNVRTSGVCFDAGIQYVTGPTDNIHFGIALKNVGPAMRFEGDGFAVQGLLLASDDILTLEQRSAEFELPSMMNIGAAYDINISELHRVTVAGNFTSNSFTRDQFILGAEYAFKKMIHVRGGYLYEKNVGDKDLRETVFTGPSAGLSIDFPFGEEKQSAIALDYAYRATNPFSGVHSIGVRLSL